MWNLFRVNNKDTRTTPLTFFWHLYCFFWADFTHSFIVEFEQVNDGWVVLQNFVKTVFFSENTSMAGITNNYNNKEMFLSFLKSEVEDLSTCLPTYTSLFSYSPFKFLYFSNPSKRPSSMKDLRWSYNVNVSIQNSK